jgi:hypothetical protein
MRDDKEVNVEMLCMLSDILLIFLVSEQDRFACIPCQPTLANQPSSVILSAKGSHTMGNEILRWRSG